MHAQTIQVQQRVYFIAQFVRIRVWELDARNDEKANLFLRLFYNGRRYIADSSLGD